MAVEGKAVVWEVRLAVRVVHLYIGWYRWYIWAALVPSFYVSIMNNTITIVITYFQLAVRVVQLSVGVILIDFTINTNITTQIAIQMVHLLYHL